jgi:hypothetical protein
MMKEPKTSAKRTPAKPEGPKEESNLDLTVLDAFTTKLLKVTKDDLDHRLKAEKRV